MNRQIAWSVPLKHEQRGNLTVPQKLDFSDGSSPMNRRKFCFLDYPLGQPDDNALRDSGQQFTSVKQLAQVGRAHRNHVVAIIDDCGAASVDDTDGTVG